MLVIALVASLAGSLAWGLRDYRNLVVYKNEQLALVDWVRAQLPVGGMLITTITTTAAAAPPSGRSRSTCCSMSAISRASGPGCARSRITATCNSARVWIS